MRALGLLALIATSMAIGLAGCKHGPDPACVSYCERHNDSCMMHASDATMVQQCDDRMGLCLQSCR